MFALFIGFVCLLLTIGFVLGNPLSFAVKSLVLLGAIGFVSIMFMVIGSYSKPSQYVPSSASKALDSNAPGTPQGYICPEPSDWNKETNSCDFYTSVDGGAYPRPATNETSTQLPSQGTITSVGTANNQQPLR